MRTSEGLMSPWKSPHDGIIDFKRKDAGELAPPPLFSQYESKIKRTTTANKKNALTRHQIHPGLPTCRTVKKKYLLLQSPTL
jgi:hypothetical protein